MSERVEIRMEQSIREYEIMRITKIFENNEINNVIKQREQFEYKLARHQKDLIDYLEYIRYERSLLSLIKERNPNENKLNNYILQRIKGLYNQATKRFANNKRLWDEFFVFMARAGSKFNNSDISALLDNTLLHHGHHVENWLKYIKWERAMKMNEKKVKNLLLRAMQRHPDSEDLHIEFIDVELSNEKDLPIQNVLDNTMLLYNNAKKTIASLTFKAAVLDKLNNYPFSKPLQLLILEDMKSMYCNKELFWHILAQRELKGLVTFDEVRNKQLEDIDAQSQLQKVNIKRCVKVYEGALSKISNVTMWSYYLNAMIELNENITSLPLLKRSVLGCAFKAAYDARQMSEEHFIQYIDIMYTTGAAENVILNIVDGALACYPTSPMLWESLMKFYIQSNDDKKVEETFNNVKRKLGNESYAIWSLYMKYLFSLTTKGRSCKIKNFFSQAMSEPSENFRALKVDCIESAATLFGMDYARQFFNNSIRNGFPCLEMYNKLAEIEAIQIEPDFENWRNCLELASHNFGHDNIDVWMDLIKFELKHGDAKSSSKIAERAIHRLKPELSDRLRSFLPSDLKDLYPTMPYDLYCPSVKEVLTDRMCKICNLYFTSQSLVRDHIKMHKYSTDAPDSPIKKIRPLRVAAKRARELLVIIAREQNMEEAEGIDKELVDLEEEWMDQEPANDIMPIISMDDVMSCPWEDDQMMNTDDEDDCLKHSKFVF